MPTKTIKEIVTDISGNTTIEFSDDSLQKFNVKDTATYSTDSNGNVVGLVGPDGQVRSPLSVPRRGNVGTRIFGGRHGQFHAQCFGQHLRSADGIGAGL